MNLGVFYGLALAFGIAFGFMVQRARLCFAHGLAEIFMGHGQRIYRLFSVIFIITSVGFLVSGSINPDLGLKPIGQLRGYGFFNVLSGMFFGAGILMNGGCILGTLRQLGEGNLTFLIVLVSFIPGMALVVYGVDPLLASRYHTQAVLLPELLGLPAKIITVILCGALAWGFARIIQRRPATKPPHVNIVQHAH